MLAVTIGIFFGISPLVAAIPFFFLLWSCLNLVYSIIWYVNANSFFLNTETDIAIFVTLVLVLPIVIMEIVSNLQYNIDATLRNVTNILWIVWAIITLYIAEKFVFSNINDCEMDSDKKRKLGKIYGIVSLVGSVCLALPFGIFGLVYAINPKGVWYFWTANHMFFGDAGACLLVSVIAAMMITNGVLMIVGKDGVCIQGGVKQGVISFVFAVVAILSVTLSLNLAPQINEWHIYTKEDFVAFYEYTDSISPNKNITVYLEADIDLEGSKLEAQYSKNVGNFHGSGARSGGNYSRFNNTYTPYYCRCYDFYGTFYGKGHKISNGIFLGELFDDNYGEIKDLTFDHCYFLLAQGTFARSNYGTISDCHALETYIFVVKGDCGSIATYGKGKIENCTFVNSNADERFPYSVCFRHSEYGGRIYFAGITARKDDAIIDCNFMGTYGVADKQIRASWTHHYVYLWDSLLRSILIE